MNIKTIASAVLAAVVLCAAPAFADGKMNLNDDEKKAFIEDIRQALYASKIVAYAQGFNEITTAAKEYG